MGIDMIKVVRTDWVYIDKPGAPLPSDGRRVKIGVMNGNVSYSLSNYYQVGGEWFNNEGEPLDRCIDVIAWRGDAK